VYGSRGWIWGVYNLWMVNDTGVILWMTRLGMAWAVRPFWEGEFALRCVRGGSRVRLEQ
jgi:hypothetical protein